MNTSINSFIVANFVQVISGPCFYLVSGLARKPNFKRWQTNQMASDILGEISE